jgi:hypothetical protein
VRACGAGIEERWEGDAMRHQIAGLIIGRADRGRDANAGSLEAGPQVFESMQVGAGTACIVVTNKREHPRGIERVVEVGWAAIEIGWLDRADRVTNLSHLLHRHE